jgi:hypothetical protein
MTDVQTEKNEKKQIRWRYYIDRKFQNVFILRFSAIVLLVVVFTLGILWMIRENPYPLLSQEGGVLIAMSTDQTLTCQSADGAILQMGVPGRVYNAFDLYWLPIVFVSGINLVLLVVFGLFYSHSMAGPVHNMRKNLQEMAAGGPVRPIRIRKGDQFQELVDDINRLIETRVK